jgi:phosphate:Na+ symporter
LRAFGERLRRWVAQATSSRIAACLTGAAVATVLQSSTASSLLAMSFVERGLISVATALATLLGTNVGTTLVVQALSFDLGAVMPVLMIAGVATFMLGQSSVVRNVGRVAIGLSLMILSLRLVVDVAGPLRDNGVLILVFGQLASAPGLAVAIAAALAWLVHSSVATVLLVMSLAGAGVIEPQVALTLALGANLGSSIAPLALSMRSPVEVRRALVGNLATRLIGVVVLLPLLGWISPAIAWLDADPARQVANFHTAFNLALAILFLPLVETTAKLLARLVRAPMVPVGQQPAALLDEAEFERPSVALVAASREVIRLAELVEIMLTEAIVTFEETDDARRRQISQLDSRVDDLQESIKLYLTRLTRTSLDEEMSRKAFDLILFTTNLEHVGDILDKNLLELAAKKQRLGVKFSQEGWDEIRALHREAVEQMRLAITVFMTQDVEMARRLVEAKDRIRTFEKSAAESHLQRLRAGTVASLETSSLHLDVIRDLKRIVAHLTSVAYPILEAGGEIATSRLRMKDAG